MHEQIRSGSTGVIGQASHERSVMDLGDLSEQQCARALEAFERLSPGDSLEIIAKQRTDRLITQLQCRYGTRFCWWPLERGPLAWRVILTNPELDAPATVTAVMSAGHLRVCELWNELERAVELRQTDRVHRCSAELSLGLRRYIDIEEKVLFPLLEAQTQMSAVDATRRMRAQHRGIERILDQLDKHRATTDYATIREIFDQPIEPMTLFQRHCRMEETALYPLMDIVFDPAEERELLRLLQEFEI